MRKIKDLTGQRFGKLVVIERAEDVVYPSGQHGVMWLCKCDCGNYKVVSKSALAKGDTRSCGCIRGENHGMSRTRLYNIWKDIYRRCYNPKKQDYADYGGRGITMCEEWKSSFIAFKDWALQNGYTDELTIERNNVNGNYKPSNCCWATKIEQANNKRNNRFLEYEGKKQTISEWARELGVSETTLRNRLNRGLSEKDVLTIPKGCGWKRGVRFNGEIRTVKEWAEVTGISYRTLKRRLWEYHWDVEKALTTKKGEK